MTEICPVLNCTGCGACRNICPVQCITMVSNDEGFLYPHIDETKCVKCGLCEKRCPATHDTVVGESEFFMAWHKEEDVLLNSSSGGAFSALAQYVFRRGGVVFGAIVNPDTREVYHNLAHNEAELAPMRLSKYYQSDVKDVYKQVKAYLNQKVFVLFTGTACQIAALYAFLGSTESKSEYLITADVLCHGTSSKKIVEQYIVSKEKQFGKKIKSISFRVKEEPVGWSAGGGTRMKIEFTDGSVYVAEKGYDSFFVGFNGNDFLRESCYRCKYCGTKRTADFTLGDFWGCRPDMVPSGQLKKGVSLLLVNSPKAKDIRSELENDLVIRSIDRDEAIPYNLALVRPQPRPKARDRFFSMMKKEGFDRCVKRLHWKRYVRYKTKRILIKTLPYSIAKRFIKSI